MQRGRRTTAGPARCRYCGSDRLVTATCAPPSQHYARTDCADCGRHNRWEPAPMSPERAAAFVLPIGPDRARGRRLDEIPRIELYRLLQWSRLPDSVARMVRFYLQSTDSRPR